MVCGLYLLVFPLSESIICSAYLCEGQQCEVGEDIPGEAGGVEGEPVVDHGDDEPGGGEEDDGLEGEDDVAAPVEPDVDQPQTKSGAAEQLGEALATLGGTDSLRPAVTSPVIGTVQCCRGVYFWWVQ